MQAMSTGYDSEPEQRPEAAPAKAAAGTADVAGAGGTARRRRTASDGVSEEFENAREIPPGVIEFHAPMPRPSPPGAVAAAHPTFRNPTSRTRIASPPARLRIQSAADGVPHGGDRSKHGIEEFDDGTFFVAASACMRRLREHASSAAQSAAPAICVGARGTGKDAVARLIHRLSKRAARPLLKLSCAATASDAIEAELFGMEHGGRPRFKPGKLELCNGGTLVLDEIVELPVHLQAKLAKALESGEFTRQGGSSRIRMTARIIATADIDVPMAILTGRLREELYHQLRAGELRLPPLRERTEDIPLLMHRTMAALAQRHGLPPRRISAAAILRCNAHSWPGNVRELEHFVRRYLLTGTASFYRSAPIGGPRRTPFELPSTPQAAKPPDHGRDLASVLAGARWPTQTMPSLLSSSFRDLLHRIVPTASQGSVASPWSALAGRPKDNIP